MPRVAACEQGDEGNLYLLESTDKFQQNPHAVAARKKLGDDGGLTPHGAFDDIHRFAGLDAGFDGECLFIVELRAKVRNEFVRYCCCIVHEGHGGRNESCGYDMPEGFLHGIAAKKVAGEHRFDIPDAAACGFLLMADPWGKRGKTGGAQVLRGEVLSLGT